MKTLLVYPRFSPYSSPPLGLAYIAANMRKEGLDVDMADCTFNMTMESLMERIRAYAPDIVGVSLVTSNLREFREIVGRIRSFNRDIKIIAGGPHPSVMPQETLRDYGVDIVIIGEGEHTMVDIVRALEKGRPLSTVRGIAYGKGKAFRRTPPRPPIEDLDSLPFPARDMLPMKNYIGAMSGRSSWTVPRPSTTIIGSRGCPYNCTFCATKLIHGRRIRLRSAKNFVDEIEHLVEVYGVKGLWFNDDSFTVDRKWVLDIFAELKERKIDIGWGCNTRVNLVDAGLLKTMKQNGCRLISYGVESGVQDVLNKYLKKGTLLSHIEKTFRLTAKTGIFSHATFMVGIPGETLDDMKKSIEFAKRIEPDAINVSIATPLPGTEFLDMCRSMGTLDMLDWEELDYMFRGVVNTADFTSEDARRMQKEFFKEFYFRPMYILTQLSRMRSLQDLKTRIRGFYQLVGEGTGPLSFFRKR
jgi:anaerobic magnesium-protoporphyrin IX monomethyl ester cyclase